MRSSRILTRRDWLSAAGLLTLAGCAGQTKEEPIWVGHIGPAGKRDESAINGMQQTLADLREREVTIAGRTIGVRHVEANDKSRARAEASRLLSVNRVACLIVGPGVEGVADVVAIARSHGALAVLLDGTADRTLADQALVLDLDPQTRGEMLARFESAKEKRDEEVWTRRMQPDPASLPPEGRAWVERYEKRFGARPDDEAILGADAIALIADGLREIAGDDRRKLAEELMGRSEIAGLTGPITRKDGRTIRPMWVERTVKGVRVGVEAVPN